MTGKLDVLAAAVIKNFRERGLSLSLAESCTGGMIAAALTGIPGASDIFWGSAVTYINSAKEHILGVSEATLERHGAVSEECAREMAESSRRIYGADVAMSVTGIAGPGGGSEAKPVGTVWFGFSSRKGTEAFCRRFEGDREAVRRQTVEQVLDCLIEKCAAEEGLGGGAE
ncbi:MAG: CinA family protein [Synergistaceae bacterium]|nr:CinA family protein [Synergistaceae bacterium]